MLTGGTRGGCIGASFATGDWGPSVLTLVSLLVRQLPLDRMPDGVRVDVELALDVESLENAL
jgi:hypothetical protein